jgi:glucose/galactose transporter
MNGTLIPYLKIACELKTDFQSYLVATCFFIAYTVMAIPSFTVIRKVGYKRSMSIGLIIMAVGAALFLPAANTRNYDLFLIGLFIIGTGMALLQTAANPYAAIIGPMESAATRISIMGICNKIAGILAGLIFGYIALKDADALEASMKTMDTLTKNATLDSLASRVIIPYLSIAGILVIVSILIFFSSLPNIDVTSEKSESTSYSERTSVLQFPHLFLGVIAMFLYVGVEVLAGDTIISYGKSLGIELSTARYFTQATLACMLIGYIVGIIAIPKYISQSNALKICSLIGVLFTIGAVLSSGYFSVAFIALLGIANSLMWPSIFPLAIDGLGKFTKIGSAFLIMAIAGGAILPLAYGYLSDEWNSQQAYWIMMPCYLFILYFSVKGYKYGKA